VNVHVQSALHNFPMLSKLVFCSAGNSSVVVASLGTLGRFRFAVWVDTIVEPSGSVTVTGVVVGCLLLHGTFMPLKWPVDPVSAIAMLNVGGPSWIVLFLRVVTTIWLIHSLGSPPCHAVVVVGFGMGFGACCCLVLCRLSLGHIILDPCCMLLRVAVVLCPSLGYLHVLLVWLWLSPCVQQYIQFLGVFFLLCPLIFCSGCMFSFSSSVALYPALATVAVLSRWWFALLKWVLRFGHV
jgi:hypothetical protein